MKCAQELPIRRFKLVSGGLQDVVIHRKNYTPFGAKAVAIAAATQTLATTSTGIQSICAVLSICNTLIKPIPV